MHSSGRFTIVRFERTAVVLDREACSIYEVFDAAAQAFDILCDLRSSFPESEGDAERVRRALRLLRREVLGESMLGPEESVAVAGADGALLFRRYPEPGSWRRSGERRGPRLELAGAIIRLDGEALVVHGAMSAATTFAHGFSQLDLDAIGWDVLAIELGSAPVVHCRAWREALPVVEVWSVEVGQQPGLTIARLPAERALVRWLASTRARPDPVDLEVLASCVQAVPHLAVHGPSHPGDVSVAVASYHGLALSSHDRTIQDPGRDHTQREEARLRASPRDHGDTRGWEDGVSRRHARR